jgi:hypothetical protein
MRYIITLSIMILISRISLKNVSNELAENWERYERENEGGITKSIDAVSVEEFEYSCERLIIELKPDFKGL